MWMSELPAFVPFYLAAILVLVSRGWLRNLILLATPVLAGLQLWLNVEPGLSITIPLANLELTIYRTDRLSLLFGYLFHIAAFIAVIFALHGNGGGPDGQSA